MAKFRGIGVSEEAYQWLVAEKLRTGLTITILVDAALVHLASLKKGKYDDTRRKPKV